MHTRARTHACMDKPQGQCWGVHLREGVCGLRAMEVGGSTGGLVIAKIRVEWSTRALVLFQWLWQTFLGTMRTTLFTTHSRLWDHFSRRIFPRDAPWGAQGMRELPGDACPDGRKFATGPPSHLSPTHFLRCAICALRRSTQANVLRFIMKSQFISFEKSCLSAPAAMHNFLRPESGCHEDSPLQSDQKVWPEEALFNLLYVFSVTQFSGTVGTGVAALRASQSRPKQEGTR